MVGVPLRYVPKHLSKKDENTQKKELTKSRRMYKRNKYHTRKRLPSFKNKKSSHITKAQEIYDIDKIVPSRKLSRKTKCKVKGLRAIFRKGQGAYYSSGSRPNQTPHSWGYARLASSLTGGPASIVDFRILNNECSQKSKALKMAKTTLNKSRRNKSKPKVKKVSL